MLDLSVEFLVVLRAKYLALEFLFYKIRQFAASEVRAAEAWFRRGIAKSQLGKRELAEQDFRRALALDPGIEAKMSKVGLVR